jgi:hypothetical protein
VGGGGRFTTHRIATFYLYVLAVNAIYLKYIKRRKTKSILIAVYIFLNDIVMNKTKDRIRIFNSFKEAKETEIQDIIKQSPIDRLRYTVELILRVYQVSTT